MSSTTPPGNNLGTGGYFQVSPNDWNKLNQALRYSWDTFDQMTGRRGTPTFYSATDHQLNRATNAADPVEPQDLVTKKYVDGLIQPTSGSLTIKTGTLFPDQRPTGLSSFDAYKIQFYSTDFDREYWWNGTGWKGVRWDGGMVGLFDVAPSTGWHVCDGSSVRVSLINGTTAMKTLPAPIGAILQMVAAGSQGAMSSLDPTDNSSLPTCLASTAITISRYGLTPYYRL